MTAPEADLFELPGRYRELQDEARALASSVAGIAAEADEADSVHPQMRARLAASGLAAVTVPRSSAAGSPASTPSP